MWVQSAAQPLPPLGEESGPIATCSDEPTLDTQGGLARDPGKLENEPGRGASACFASLHVG